mmetsp:Transcript_26974/g.67943  ORF Transcript_26974/g.67943 Transcript_26974/m.67943 type:complete len:534 (-) Transcript_26974:503-2104(-)
MGQRASRPSRAHDAAGQPREAASAAASSTASTSACRDVLLAPADIHCFLDSTAPIQFAITTTAPDSVHPHLSSATRATKSLDNVGLLFALCDADGNQRANLDQLEGVFGRRTRMLSHRSEGGEVEDIADKVDGDSHNQPITRIEHTISLTAIRHLPDWLETIAIGTQPADRSSAQRFGRLRVSLSVKQQYSFENILVEEPCAPALDEPICLAILTRRRSSVVSLYSPTTWKLHALQQPIPHGLSLKNWLERQVFFATRTTIGSASAEVDENSNRLLDVEQEQCLPPEMPGVAAVCSQPPHLQHTSERLQMRSLAAAFGRSAGGRRAGAYVSGGGTSSRSSVGGSDVYEEVLRNPVVLAFVHTQMQQEQRVRREETRRLEQLRRTSTAARAAETEPQVDQTATAAAEQQAAPVRGPSIGADFRSSNHPNCVRGVSFSPIKQIPTTHSFLLQPQQDHATTRGRSSQSTTRPKQRQNAVYRYGAFAFGPTARSRGAGAPALKPMQNATNKPLDSTASSKTRKKDHYRLPKPVLVTN